MKSAAITLGLALSVAAGLIACGDNSSQTDNQARNLTTEASPAPVVTAYKSGGSSTSSTATSYRGGQPMWYSYGTRQPGQAVPTGNFVSGQGISPSRSIISGQAGHASITRGGFGGSAHSSVGA